MSTRDQIKPPPEEIRDHFHNSPEWCVLSEIDLDTVIDKAVHRRFETGSFVFYEGEPCKGVYLIEEGMIGIRKNGYEGHTTLLKVATRGDTLGYRPLLAEQPHRASADAIVPSVVCFVDAMTCRQLIKENPALGLNFLKRAAQELGDSEARFHDTVSLSVQARFAHLLAVLKDDYGEVDNDGVLHLTLPVSRGDLAAMLGIRRESLSRVIHELEDQDVAHFRKRAVEIPNPEELLSRFR